NWFEVLTAQASLGEGHVDDNDDLCANQEGLFKAPLEKTAVESQLFSTPKVFRRSQMVSPETEDEPSFTADSYVKHISESLGAQINPDISWTSSFNTPPAMPSTLILCELLKHMACIVLNFCFKTDMHHLPSSNESGNPTINAEVSLHISTKDKNLDTGKGIDLHTESTSAGHSRSREETVDESNCSQLEKASIVPFANASGFKTASNKGIHISPANLERGKRFFEEADGEKTSHDLSITTPYAKNNKRNLIPETTKPKPSNSNLLPKVERPFVNINSHLTASEKADVTELCCLLEEADSQFEFTQFKPAKNLPNRINLYTDLSMSNSLRENSSSELKSNSTLMHGQGFKTAGGVMLQVSKKSLSRARALFAELENNLTEQKRADKQESKNVAQTEQKCDVDSDICKHNSFILKESCDVSNKSENCFSNLDEVRCSNKNPSSVEDKNVLESSETDAAKCEIGKGISISAKHMKGADVLFKDCQVIEHKEEKSTKAPPESVERGRSFSNFKSPKVNIYKEGFAGCSKFENENSALIAHTGGLHRDEVERNSMSTPALKNENGKKPFSTSKPSAILGTSKSIDLSASKDLCTSDGFRTAAGKNISVSVAAMRNAASLLNQIDTPVETNKQPNQKKKTSETECLSNVMSKIDNGGFETVVEVRKFATLKKPTLSKEHEKSEDKIGANQSKIPGNDPRSGGFFAASDEPGFLSSEALEKEKALFSDSSLNMDDVSETVAVRIEKPETRLCSYTTAGGTKDQVSQKNLPKPKDQFEELDDLDLTKAVDEEGLFSVFDEGNVRGSKQAELYNCYPGDKKKINISIKAGCSRGAEKQVEVKENILPQASHGLQAASGRKAGVSSHSLKRVESLCSEFEEIKNKTNATTPQFEATAPPLKNSVFHSVSGKPMAPSAEEVEKPKSLFGNITRRAEDPDVSQTRKTDDIQDDQNKSKKICCGFTTARGKKVNVSQKNLQKAKILLKEVSDLGLTKAMQDADILFRDDEDWTLDSNSDASLEQTNKVSTKESGSITGNLSQLKPDKKQTVDVCEEPESSSIKANQKEGCSMPGQNGEFETASGKTVVVSCGALSRAKFLSENNATTPQFKATAPPLKNSGFHSVSGKPMAPSAEEVEKPKSLFGNITRRAEVPDVSQTRKTADKQDDQNKSKKICCGFTTARGEKVNVSQKNLQKAKILFKEVSDLGLTKAMQDADILFRDDEGWTLDSNSDASLEQTNKVSTKESGSLTGNLSQLKPDRKQTADFCEEPESGLNKANQKEGCSLPGQNGGFQTASGKTVIVSCEALSRAKLLSENNSTTLQFEATAPPLKNEVPDVLQTRKTDDKQDDQNKSKKTFCGFTTARGEKVNVSQKNLQKAKILFKEVSDLGLTKAMQDADISFRDDEGWILDGNSDASSEQTNKVSTKESGSITGNLSQLKPDRKQAAGICEEPESSSIKANQKEDRTENIMLARDMQDMRIRKKKRQTIRPLPGSLFLTKTSGVLRIPLKLAVNGNKPTRCSAKELYECGVHKHVPEITGANAESFRFNLLQFIKQEMITDGGGVQLADGGWLIPSNDWTAGKEEFYRALCDTPGVDPKLITEQWVYNHYRWIVWKQASMEKSFPEKMGSLCLTPEQILLQLKYRYDVEVDHSRRPALKKIMERDDTPAKTLILCVCEIVSRGHLLNAQSRSDTKTTQSAENNPSAIIWLTDGWYAIKAQLDEPLTAMLHKGRLAVGGKLMIHGAQLVGSQDACSPLEAPDSLMLKICANSTRRARWDAKLGFHKDPRPFLLPISCLFSNGGLVGCVDVLILRSYPMQWMERKSDGGVVFRSDRAEEKEARRFSHHKQKVMEMLFAKIQAEFEKEEEGRQTISKQDVANLQEGVELYEAVGDDPAYLEAHLSKKQMETLQAYRSSLMEKKQAELQDRYRRALDAEDNEMSCPKRDVAPVWRLCIADSKDQSSCVYKLNLWRPSSDLQSLLKEGCRFKVYNLAVSDGKNRSTIETVQLTGTKKTQFQEMPASPEWLSSRFQPRVATDFADLQNEEFKPLCGEVDLVGYVISVIDQQGPSPAFYLVDGKQNFVKVRCFTSLAQAGLEDVVKPGVLLALSNLQLRGQSMYPTPVVYAGDLTAFSTNPKEIHLQESLQQLKSLVTFQKPGKSLGSFTPVSSKLPAPTSSTEKDPKSLKRKRALDYLSRIPSPPPISPLGSVVSPCVKRTFNPPRRSGPPSTLKPAQTVEPKRADSLVEDEWVNDEELAMIDTQELHVGNLFSNYIKIVKRHINILHLR
uniref:Tower domain-containing protein n=1 Tax=Cyprinodon variegatus TaxID=28743 RepID=A0A3Q2CW94_CYPVA